MYARHHEQMLGEATARVMIEIVVGFGARGPDPLLVDERVDKQGIALVGLGAVGKTLSVFAGERLRELWVVLHVRADLLHQILFARDDGLAGANDNSRVWFENRGNGQARTLGDLLGLRAKIFDPLRPRPASLVVVEQSGANQHRDEETDLPGTPHNS